MKIKHLSLLVAGILAGPAHAQIDATGTLPNAKPGECYAKVIIPAKYETRTEQIVVREASERVEVKPAKYEWVEERVMVEEASFKLVPIASQYETVTDKIEVKPAATVWTLRTPNGLTKSAGASLVAYARGAGLPADSASPGQCFVEYYRPAQFRSETQQVVKKEAGQSIDIVPAKYQWVEEKVLVEEASTRVEKISAVYETLTEKVQIAPATTVWKKGSGPIQRIDNTTGEIMCLVEVPAQFKTITKRVVRTPATTRTIDIPARYESQRVRKLMESAREIRKEIPAEYTEITRRSKVSDESVAWYLVGGVPAESGKPTGNRLCLTDEPARYESVTKRVLKNAASTKRIEVPAKYKSVKIRKLVEAAGENRIPVPAKTDQVSKRVKVTDERLEWRSVLCETNTTANLVVRVQQALSGAGFNPGPIDGNLGSMTLRAIDAYQRKNSMPRGGLTMDTLRSLNISL